MLCMVHCTSTRDNNLGCIIVFVICCSNGVVALFWERHVGFVRSVRYSSNSPLYRYVYFLFHVFDMWDSKVSAWVRSVKKLSYYNVSHGS